MMKVNEIFLSIQGESLSAGFPTIFVRFTGCNLRCFFCDTKYSYYEGIDMPVDNIMEEIEKLHYRRVCLTGGEPLLQPEINMLLGRMKNYIVTIETNGSVALGGYDTGARHSFVMDIKCPSSGQADKMDFNNFNILRECDEIKFVIQDYEDFIWAKEIIRRWYKKGAITVSPVYGRIKYSDAVEWILESRLDVRFQIQLHKIIWDPNMRGV